MNINTNYNIEIIEWYKLTTEIDYNNFLHINLLIIEKYNDFNFNIKYENVFNNFISIIHNLSVISYPLLYFNIFPFYFSHFGFSKNKIIDNLLLSNSKIQIIHNYEYNRLKFNPSDNYYNSLNKLIISEQSTSIKPSSFIINNINSTLLFIDSIFPSFHLFEFIIINICNLLNINYNFDIFYNTYHNSEIYKYHLNNMFYTPEMISDLNLPIDKIFNYNSLNSFNHWLNVLKKYLNN